MKIESDPESDVSMKIESDPKLRLRTVVTLSAVGMALLSALPTSPQTYPTKSIRIVTSVTGGGLDLTARVIAPRLGETLGQQVIVDNRGGVISMELVAKAPPDGYTLLLASSGLWLSHLLRENVAWDLKDYAPITLLVSSPNIVAVHPSLPVRSINELIALAKAKPGELNYSSGQSGASSHLAGELFKAMAGVNIVRIGYKGQGPAMLALVTGEAQLSFANAASSMPYVKGGKIRGLAVTSAQPSALAPGLPTVAASGLPGYESKATLGMFAPARTPPPIVEQLNTQIVRTLNSSDVKQRLFDSGAEVIAGSPPELAAVMMSEMEAIGKIIKQAGIRAD
jgi:tripartite-type tricarboxylate transporter receptor subunit TctC